MLLVWGCFSVSKTIIPDAKEHFLTHSARRHTHPFGGFGLKEQKQADRKPRVKPQRIWRMREDLFEGVWCDVLGWLQEDQDASPVALLGRLREAVPHRSNRALLSELRRRVQRWRGIIGNNMVYVVCESSLTDPVGMRVMAPIGGHPKC